MTTDLLNIHVQKPAETSWNKINLTVLIAEQAEGGYQATVLGWSDCQGSGLTKEEAIANLNQALSTRLETTEIAALQIVNPNAEHPWMKLAGKYKDDPDFDEMLANIEALRQERNAEMEAYYRQLDEEDEAYYRQLDEEDEAQFDEGYDHQFDEEDEAQFDEGYDHSGNMEDIA